MWYRFLKFPNDKKYTPFWPVDGDDDHRHDSITEFPAKMCAANLCVTSFQHVLKKDPKVFLLEG